MPLLLSPFLGDHMVIQADVPSYYRGWAHPGATVQIDRPPHTVTAVVDAEGRWSANLPSLPAGGPHEIVFRADSEEVILRDVLYGDLWMCSGQSNMQWPLNRSSDWEEEKKQASQPFIRIFTTERTPALAPAQEMSGQWALCEPETAAGFSAVAYYFAKEVQASTGRPIGLIGSYWGGTPAQSWTSLEAMEAIPAMQDSIRRLRSMIDHPDHLHQLRYLETQWPPVSVWQDPGNRGFFNGWAEPGNDDSAWPTMALPGFWQQRGLLHHGAVWFRKSVAIPADWAGQDLELSLGVLDDFDVTYCNGWQVGQTGQETPRSGKHRRVYRIPAACLRPGQPNCLTVRIFDHSDYGGFGGGVPLQLRLAERSAAEAPIRLEGLWKYRVEHAFPMTIPDLARIKHRRPASLFNGMVKPFVDFPVRGVIWYQGEANVAEPDLYATLFPALIQNWRAAWRQPDMPFIFVLLARFRVPQTEPVETGWPDLRAAQMAALALPYTGVASATDTGESNNVHPRDKKTVGLRLGRVARRMVYGHEVVAAGPRFREMTRQGGRLLLHFDEAPGGLATPAGQPLRGFAIRSDRGPWQWAEAIITGNAVILEAPGLPDPAHAAYAWASFPNGNLINGEGWPALPFRTDR